MMDHRKGSPSKEDITVHEFFMHWLGWAATKIEALIILPDGSTPSSFACSTTQAKATRPSSTDASGLVSNRFSVR